MIKQKLINKRIAQNFTQEQMADLLYITQSQYSRREKGITKISKKEWAEMARLLNTALENIYEPEDGIYIFTNAITKENLLNGQDSLNQMREHVIINLKKYIEKLEEENTSLKEQLKT